MSRRLLVGFSRKHTPSQGKSPKGDLLHPLNLVIARSEVTVDTGIPLPGRGKVDNSLLGRARIVEAPGLERKTPHK
jgi:hypothetical protein